ncbi:hypothetical protein SAMN04487859_1592 [Roseovarius lutimaris]|uniref:Uncharacterized protein n=1 Tax=Roseovarius lutimaris TaxID=1005928 RepID=A0A1I5H773_9RHOB|nr:hypothetical protein [Roseovarius lutimaris]SFO44043.1 hypothetical protein SAMN04487859_1592 [Roseovarius lutimaris]
MTFIGAACAIDFQIRVNPARFSGRESNSISALMTKFLNKGFHELLGTRGVLDVYL